MSYNIIDDEDIDAATATDAYFLRTEESLQGKDKNPNVVAEVTAHQRPKGDYKVLTGLPDVAELFKDLPVDVYSLPEGTIFDGGPVLRIEGNYLDFARYETSLLGFLSQASGFATAAMKARLGAPNSEVLSFGARHLNPALATVLERNALIAGLDGISHVAAANELGVEAVGTMPHALIIPFGRGNQEEAWKAFDDGVDESVPRIALCDTFSDEKDEVLRVVEELGESLDGVRLDTTGSRRGDFRQIIEEVNWELESMGREDVSVYATGGIVPEEMKHLRDVVDGFGVGSYISDADPLDFGLDIIEVDGEPVAKRGKFSGVKQVYHKNGQHKVCLEGNVPEMNEPLLKPLIKDGDVVRDIDFEKSAETLHQNIGEMLN